MLKASVIESLRDPVVLQHIVRSGDPNGALLSKLPVEGLARVFASAIGVLNLDGGTELCPAPGLDVMGENFRFFLHEIDRQPSSAVVHERNIVQMFIDCLYG